MAPFAIIMRLFIDRHMNTVRMFKKGTTLAGLGQQH